MSEGRRPYPERRVQPVKHGLYARGASALRLRARKVAKLVDRVRTVAPWIEGSDLPCARSWAELEILGAACFRELVEKGVLNSEGEPTRMLSEYRQLKLAQLRYEEALGMTPASRQALRATSGRAVLDIAAAMAMPSEDAPTGESDE